LPISLEDARRMAAETVKIARASSQEVTSDLMARIQAERRLIGDYLDQIRVESRTKYSASAGSVPQ
jgi:hypothetical protein